MDKLANDRQVVQEPLTEHSQVQLAFGEVQMKLMLEHDISSFIQENLS